MKYESSHELAAKVAWEGGLAAFVFEYGIKAEDIPDDMPADIKEKFGRLISAGDSYEDVSAYISDVGYPGGSEFY